MGKEATMPVPVSPGPWWGSLLWLVGLTSAAFVVAWLTGTRLQIRRALYIPILLIVTAALSVGYVTSLDIGATDVLTARWGWGLLAGILVGALLVPAVKRQPVDRQLSRRDLPATLLWEGVVYGTAEGMLLSGLPAFMTWQMVHALGWAGAAGAVARWTLPILASAAVIVIHHLGYWNCRNRILVPITAACSLLTLAYLLSGSFVAPALGHILLHFGADLHGIEMPPNARPATIEGKPHVARGTHLKAA
jgi:hypothetical protein